MEQTVFLKTLEGALAQMETIPLWGNPPSFPWEKFSSELAQTLDQKNLKITHHRSDWLEGNGLLDGMGEKPLILPFTLSPLPTPFFWVMAHKTQKTLTDMLLSGDQKNKGFTDPALLEGFTHYLFLNIMDTFNRLNPFGNLNATFADDQPLPRERSLCIDVAVQAGLKPFWGRIICPPETLASFKSYFQNEKPPLYNDTTAHLPVTLHFEVGRTALPFSEWKKAKVGDLVLLESCTYDIKASRGTAVLTLGNTPLFDVRIKEGQIKLLEYALLHEELSMAKEFSDEEFSEEEMGEEEKKPLWAPNGETLGKEELVSSANIPLNLTVEIGRVQMTLEKVAQLKPGNVLDLGFGPNPNVYIMANGKHIAKGELVRLGETIGVKILDIGA